MMTGFKQVRNAAIAAGLTRYFTGVPCRHGHLAERRVCNGGCVECSRLAVRKFYAANTEACRARSRNWLDRNLAKEAEYKRAWRAANRGKINSLTARRRAGKLAATPIWADQKKIAAVYVEAKRRGLHVDHQIPLRGSGVCGLHVHENLQLLTPIENSRKGSRW